MKKFTPIITEMLNRKTVEVPGVLQNSLYKCDTNCQRLLEMLLAHNSLESLEILTNARHGGNKGLISDVRKLKIIADERMGERL